MRLRGSSARSLGLVESVRSGDKDKIRFFPMVVSVETMNVLNAGDIKDSVIQQGGGSSKQTASTVGKDEASRLEKLLERIDAGIQDLAVDDRAQLDLKAEIATIRSQLSSSSPKRSVVRDCLASVKTILEGAGGTIVGALVIDISKFLL